MPITAENWARYPADWREISQRIRFERAGGRCECEGECGNDHGGRCAAVHREPHPVTGSIVFLTTAHLDHQPENSTDENLRAFCPYCHNHHDRDHRQANAARTWAAKRAAAELEHAIAAAQADGMLF